MKRYNPQSWSRMPYVAMIEHSQGWYMLHSEIEQKISEAINLLENVSPRYDPEAEQDPIDAYVTLYSRVKGAIEKLKELT